MTEMVISYQQGNVSFEAVSGHICLYVYDYPRRIRRWDQDLCSDFFEYFYPRIKRMADSFVYSGYPFETYLNVTLRHQMKTFMRKREQKELKETLFCQMCASGSHGDESSFYKIYDNFNYEVRKKAPTYYGKLGQPRTRRRLFFLALTDPDRLDDAAIERLAATIGFSVEYIIESCLAVKEKIQWKRDEIQHLREKKNGYYFQLLVLQNDIMTETDPDKRAWLSERLRKARSHIDHLSRKIQIKTSCLVSHHELAQVLGLAKGTVDSGIFYMKRRNPRHSISSSSADRQSLHSLQR